MEFHVTVDFNDDLWFSKGRWDESRLRDFVRWHARQGIAAIHWIDHGGKAEGFYAPGTWIDALAPASYFFELVPEPLEVVCDEARKLGLRVFSVLKAFDLAMGPPWGSYLPAEQPGVPGIPHVGGVGAGFHWVREHQECRAELHPKLRNQPRGGPLRRIRLWHENAAAPGAWELWISEDNRTYRRYEGPRTVVTGVRARRTPLFAPAPEERFAEAADCAFVEFGGLDLDAPFVALAAQGESALANTLAGIAELEDAAGAVPFTFGLGPVRRHGQTPDWKTRGIAYDAAYGTPVPGRGWTMEWSGGRTRIEAGKTGWIGFARGRNAHLTALLEPACPEVRAFVLGRAEHALRLGCVGVDLRVSSHTESLDWENYGFNAPVLEAFRARHGVDPATQPFDRGAWRRLRGEFFTQMLREVSIAVRARGGRMLAHLHDLFDRPPEKEALHHMHFDWRAWLAERLLDGGSMNSFAFREPFYAECIRLCRDHGADPIMTVPMHSADDAAWKAYGFELIDRAGQDGFAAFNIYESASVMHLEGDGFVETTPSLWTKVREMARP